MSAPESTVDATEKEPPSNRARGPPAAAARHAQQPSRSPDRRKTTTTTTTASSSSRSAPPSDRPCDICRRRKLRCVREPGNDKCYLCDFYKRACTFVERPQRRKQARRHAEAVDAEAGTNELPNASVASGEARDGDSISDYTGENHGILAGHEPIAATSPASLLNRTLGLHKTTHSVYIGPSSLQEPRLVRVPERASSSGPAQQPTHRRVDASTVFIQRRDPSSGEEDVLESIEDLVRPHGPALVTLYFRIVHPSYPILHKGVWLEKYQRSYKEFSAPLLAAVYALAIDWWEYDLALYSKEKPPVDRLVAIAMQSLTMAIASPKLSAVQAGLLLLQRSGGDSWVLTSQMVALSEELGLHVDCSSWDIPDWEKGVRRRLTWAVFMQDKWGALIHGRPSHVSALHWRAPHLQLDDFPESASDEDDTEGSTEVEKGRYLFMHLARLTEIMSEAHSTLYNPYQVSHDHGTSPDEVMRLLEHIKPIALRLKHWASTIPAGLGMDDVRTRKLSSNGYLHLSYYITEIIIHRHVIRSLTPSTPDHVRSVCRDAAQARLERAMTFVEKLRPEHLQSFWWFAAPKSLALIGVFAALLSATSRSAEEAAFYKQKLDDFHWSLKVRSKGSVVITAAVREMDDGLLDLDPSGPPLPRSSPANSTGMQQPPLALVGHQEPVLEPLLPIFPVPHVDEDMTAFLVGAAQEGVMNEDDFANLSELPSFWV